MACDSVQGGKEKCDGVCQLQKQVKEVEGIMRDNINKALDRGEKLEDLEDRSKQLEIGVRMNGSEDWRHKKRKLTGANKLNELCLLKYSTEANMCHAVFFTIS